ncbi:MAG: fibronectin type III domain-containing protein [Clostridia bacterium]|nr:fibronectin type III domain-containing protein [Clostridia bacterium]
MNSRSEHLKRTAKRQYGANTLLLWKQLQKPKLLYYLSSLQAKKQLTATWKTVSGATGYEVVYSTSKKFTKKTTKTATIKKAKTKKTTIKKLKKGKKYYFKVRAYKTVDGKKIYGALSSVKNVKIK